MAAIGQGVLAWMRAVYLTIFFFAKSTEMLLYTKNHYKHVLRPREVLFQIWKPSMEVCHCLTQICAGRFSNNDIFVEKSTSALITAPK